MYQNNLTCIFTEADWEWWYTRQEKDRFKKMGKIQKWNITRNDKLALIKKFSMINNKQKIIQYQLNQIISRIEQNHPIPNSMFWVNCQTIRSG